MGGTRSRSRVGTSLSAGRPHLTSNLTDIETPMLKTWNYQQLTDAVEKELQDIAGGAPAADPAIRVRRAGVAHGVYMLWHNVTTHGGQQHQDRRRLEALAKSTTGHAEAFSRPADQDSVTGLLQRLAGLNRDAGEIGAGMLAQLVDEARLLLAMRESTAGESELLASALARLDISPN